MTDTLKLTPSAQLAKHALTESAKLLDSRSGNMVIDSASGIVVMENRGATVRSLSWEWRCDITEENIPAMLRDLQDPRLTANKPLPLTRDGWRTYLSEATLEYGGPMPNGLPITLAAGTMPNLCTKYGAKR
ncbi:MAG: hypothetical protein V4735_09740 [Pseudomonadota bacterium]